jgi:hypothetical protein
MAYVDKPSVSTSGAYRHLAEAEEKEFGLWQFYGSGRRAYPRQRRLDALRAGRLVTVFAADLPRKARGGWVGSFPRVTVGPDDTVIVSDENGTRAWLEENDL